MTKRKKKVNPIERARTTIASVNKEMQRPRLAESVRSSGRGRAPMIAEKLPVRSAKFELAVTAHQPIEKVSAVSGAPAAGVEHSVVQNDIEQ